MPLDKDMNHEEMVQELMRSYKETGKIGSTKPRDEKHALQIANAVAYNISESEENKKIEKEVKEMRLSEILDILEDYLDKSEAVAKVTLDNGQTIQAETEETDDEIKKDYEVGKEIEVGQNGVSKKTKIKSVEVTREVGEQLETKDLTTIDFYSDDTLIDYFVLAEGEKQFRADIVGHGDTELGYFHINKNDKTLTNNSITPTSEELKEYLTPDREERIIDYISSKLNNKTILETKTFDQDSYNAFVEDPTLYDLEMLQDLKQGFMDKRGAWTDEDIAELNAITKRIKELKSTNESFSDKIKDVEQTYKVDLSKNLKFDGLDELPEEYEEFITDSNTTFGSAQDYLEEKGITVEKVNEPIIETNYILYKAWKSTSYYNKNHKESGVLEIDRVTVVTHNGYEVAEMILKELQDRYPEVLEENLKVHSRSFKIDEEDSGDMGVDPLLPFGKKNKVKKSKNRKFNRSVKFKN